MLTEVALSDYPNECNELLCFMQQKTKVMVFDHIVDVCLNFYSSDEIKRAHSLILKYAKHRLPLHKGAEKDKKTLTDLLKVCLDPNVKLPVFYAVQIGRLPPVSIDHVDLSAILHELISLRNEVKGVALLRTEMGELRSCLKALSLEKDADSTAKINQVPKPRMLVDDDKVDDNGATAAQVLKKAIQSGIMRTQQVRRPKAIVGVKSGTALRVVQSRKTVDVFISRLSPDTTVEEVNNCALDVLRTDSSFDLAHINVKCSLLKAKFDSYCSYHVAVGVDSGLFGKAVDLLMTSEAWPAGVLVRRYFNINK
jgi:hypothetical protein